jgi:hypothetical protein
MSAAEIATMVHALIMMVIVELLIRWVRLARLSHLLGVRLDLESVRVDGEMLPPSELTLRERRQLQSASRLARVWPFGRGPCLRRSLVIGHLLRRRQPAVRLGTVGGGADLVAHAWVEIDGRPLESLVGVTSFQADPATMSM